MPIFEQGDIIRVLFSISTAMGRHDYVGGKPIRGSVPDQAGPPAPSVVRPVKIATIEMHHADPIGKLLSDAYEGVMQCIRTTLCRSGRLAEIAGHGRGSCLAPLHLPRQIP